MANEIYLLPPSYSPSPLQERYVSLLANPLGPETVEALAQKVGVPSAQVAVWYGDPQFRNWATWEVENRFAMLLPLIWKEAVRLAMNEGTDARVRLEAMRMVLGRFDVRGEFLKSGMPQVADKMARILARRSANRQ